MPDEEKKNIIINGFNKLPENEKNKILLNGFNKLPPKEKNKILLKGFNKLSQKEKNKILLKGYETLSEKEKNKILLKGYEKYENDKKIEELLQKDYNIVQTVNGKLKNGLSEKEIEEWNKLRRIPKWKLKCMEYFHISENQYDESKKRIDNPHFRCCSMNLNNDYSTNIHNKIYGPYTIRGMNDYNNNIKLFPLYRFAKQIEENTGPLPKN